jgi:hypothetical protein
MMDNRWWVILLVVVLIIAAPLAVLAVTGGDNASIYTLF